MTPNDGDTIGRFAWHVHHNLLCEPLTESLAIRRQYIRGFKPLAEQRLRLRLLALVQGVLPTALVACGMENFRLRTEGDRLCAESVRLWDESTSLCAESFRLLAEGYRLRTEGIRLWVFTLDEHRTALTALHDVECPGCPWDGQTIFSSGVRR